MTAPKQIKVVFASSGDTIDTPDALQVDGSVSYTEGYTFDYQRLKASSPAAKDINRSQQNGLFRDAFANIQQYQLYSAPEFYTATPYDIYTKVHHSDGSFYVSTKTANTTTPGASQDWAKQAIPVCEDRNGNVVQFYPTESAVGAGTIKTARLASQGVDIGANSTNIGALAAQCDEGLLAGQQIALIACYGDFVFTDETSTNVGFIGTTSSSAQITGCSSLAFAGVNLGSSAPINASGNSGGFAVSQFNSLDSSSGVASVASNSVDISFGVNSVVLAADNSSLVGDDESNTVKQSAIIGSSYSSVQGDSTSRVVLGSRGVLPIKDYTLVGGYNTVGDAPAIEAINWSLDSVTGLFESQNIRVLRGNTEEVDPLILTVDALGPAYWNQVKLALNSAASFKATIVAYSSDGDASSWEITGLIKVGASVATTAIVGTPTITMLFQDAGASTWDVDVAADIGNGILQTIVTGAAATDITWQATLNITRTNT